MLKCTTIKLNWITFSFITWIWKRILNVEEEKTGRVITGWWAVDEARQTVSHLHHQVLFLYDLRVVWLPVSMSNECSFNSCPLLIRNKLFSFFRSCCSLGHISQKVQNKCVDFVLNWKHIFTCPCQYLFVNGLVNYPMVSNQQLTS
jgi:hypothetical protein